MTEEIQRFDFIESVFYQNLTVSPELYDYVRGLKLDKNEHVETNFDHAADAQLYKLTLACVDKFFVNVGKQLKKTGLSVVKMWVQKYAPRTYHPVHVHATDKFHYSFVFYVDCTENSAPTMFYNLGFPYVDHEALKIQPVKGRCVLFPGAMPHEAMPNKDDQRLIVSGNIVFVDRTDARPT